MEPRRRCFAAAALCAAVFVGLLAPVAEGASPALALEAPDPEAEPAPEEQPAPKEQPAELPAPEDAERAEPADRPEDPVEPEPLDPQPQSLDLGALDVGAQALDCGAWCRSGDNHRAIWSLRSSSDGAGDAIIDRLIASEDGSSVLPGHSQVLSFPVNSATHTPAHAPRSQNGQGGAHASCPTPKNVSKVAGSSTGVNSLGIGPDGAAYFTNQYATTARYSSGYLLGCWGNSPYTWNQYVDVWRVDLAAPSPAPQRLSTVAIAEFLPANPGKWAEPYITGGAVNRVDGRFYFTSYEDFGADQTRLRVWRQPASGSAVEIARVITGPGERPGKSGDIAFDGDGNLQFTFTGGAEARLGTVPLAALPADTPSAPVQISRDQITVSRAIVDGTLISTGPGGVAYLPTGQVVWGTNGGTTAAARGHVLQVRNPADFARIGADDRRAALTEPRDLASFATPPTVQVRKHVVQRAHPDDQFTIAAGTDIAAPVSATTSGESNGLQPRSVTLPVLGGHAIDVGEILTEGSPTGDLDAYRPRLTCVNQVNGVEIVNEALRLQANGTHGRAGIEMPRGSAGDASQGPRTVCTITNDPTQPTKTADVAEGRAVAAGSQVAYTLRWDNTDAGGRAPSSLGLPVDHLDHLGDVLDDAALDESSVTVLPESVRGSLTAEYDAEHRRIAIRGVVPPGVEATVAYRVTVHPNDHEATARQAGSPRDGEATARGYALTNFLLPRTAWSADEGAPELSPPPAPAPGQPDGRCAHAAHDAANAGACASHPVAAWTVRKDSQPEDGAKIHSGGNVYYRVQVTNFSGEDLAGVTVRDDLTETLSASVLDFGARDLLPVPWGISYYDRAGDEIAEAPGRAVWTAADLNAPGGPRLSCQDCDDFDPDFQRFPFAGGRWLLESPEFSVPARVGDREVAYAIVGYVVQGGWVADPSDATRVYADVVEPGEPAAPVPARPNASWVNTVQAGPGAVGETAGVLPNRCSAAGAGVEPGDTGADHDCKTRHSLDDSYFHIWKKSAAPGEVGANLQGSEFVLADTEQQAVDGLPSRWLCRVDNAPGDPALLADPGSEASLDATPGGAGFRYAGAGSRGAWGSDAWGHSSTQAGGVHHWLSATNTAREAWNVENADAIARGEATAKEILPMCGVFFRVDDESYAEGQALGSWRAMDIRGGSTAAEVHGGDSSEPLPGWRTESAPNDPNDPNQGLRGTYWLAERLAPEGHDRLTRPMKLWVAPDSPTPAGTEQDDPRLYDYQGRLSLPETGEQPETTALRDVCASPYRLPGDHQPSCVMPTGWTMPVFDPKPLALPLTGGVGTSALVAGGAALLLAVLGAAGWRRRAGSRRAAAPAPDDEAA